MFGLNNAQIIGRLGADATVSHLTSGGRVANVSVATDESYLDRNSGDKVDRTEWHRIVTFQDGLVDMLEKHAKKGRLVYVSGKLQTRKWRKDGEDSDRYLDGNPARAGRQDPVPRQAERQRCGERRPRPTTAPAARTAVDRWTTAKSRSNRADRPSSPTSAGAGFASPTGAWNRPLFLPFVSRPASQAFPVPRVEKSLMRLNYRRPRRSRPVDSSVPEHRR